MYTYMTSRMLFECRKYLGDDKKKKKNVKQNRDKSIRTEEEWR